MFFVAARAPLTEILMRMIPATTSVEVIIPSPRTSSTTHGQLVEDKNIFELRFRVLSKLGAGAFSTVRG